MQVTQAVIACAGNGTRMMPFTSVVPKELLPIGSKPAIHYIVDELTEAGIKEIIFVYKDKLIKDYITKNIKTKCTFIEQTGDEYGNAVPLKMVSHIKGNFIYAFGDDLTLGNATKQLIREKTTAIATQMVKGKDIEKYGTVKFFRDSREVDMICEKVPMSKAPSSYAVYGRYLLTPDIWKALRKTKEGKNKELWLADVINNLETAVIAPVMTAEWHTIGNVESYIKAINKIYGKDIS